jgi:hemoglobin
MRARILLALAVLVAAVGLCRADDKPVDRTELDKRIVATVYEVALRGTKMFNDDKNYEGCYRLYEGALMALVPVLDHRQKLQATVKMRLDRATKMKASDAAFELRTALDEIQNEIAPPKDKKPDEKKLTIWDRLGGDKGVRKIVDDIVATAAEDKKVNFFRDGKVKLDAKGVDHFKQMLVELISANSGGPLKYTGKTMKDAHKGMMITDAEFDALVDVIVGVLKKHKVSAEDTAALGKVVESTRKDIVEVPKK